MVNSDAGDHLEPPPPLGSARPLSNAGPRFSRYLRLARHRRGRNIEGGHGDDPTNPPMPVAPETSVHNLQDVQIPSPSFGLHM